MKLKIGITGKEGFVGQHLYNTLGLFPDEFERIDYVKGLFEEPEKLQSFVSHCDVIIHLAAMNRHNDPQVIYDTNIGLVNQLIIALESSGSKAHVLFSSSSQEDRDNLYGKSKKDGRQLLENWAQRAGGTFTGMVIPNVFGPFGHPYYNSFIATFSHQLSHNEQPKIDVDGDVKLIYVDDLVKSIITRIRMGTGDSNLVIPHTVERKVSEILALLESYKAQYLELGVIP
ncbi:MAG: NAD-dependent epimerase/dehydratase family protein, partial [Proteobacteria bacterium]